MVRKILALVIGGALALASLLISLPANAEIVPDDGGFIDTQTCEDAGGVPYTVSAHWRFKYEDPAGKTRVSLIFVVERDDGDAGPAADAGVDLHWDVSSHGTVRWTQHRIIDGLDLDFAADDQATINARNPISDANDTFLRVKVGTDGDGLDNCEWLYFIQPAGIEFRAPSS